MVLQSPGPVTMPWVRRVGAIVEAWWPGEEGGNAIADVLLGKVNPSGKLPVTYPRALTDVPARTKEQFPGVGGRAVYSEGVLVGYRWYDRRGIRPLFPFGHGLSYTSFHYRDLEVRELRGGSPGGTGRVRVSLRVANVGPRRGAEVVQVYLGLPRPVPGIVQPPKALKRFRRVEIPSGRSRDLTFVLEDRDFSFWDADTNRWRVAPGCYRVLVGSSSRDIRLRDVLAAAARAARGRRRSPRRGGGRRLLRLGREAVVGVRQIRVAACNRVRGAAVDKCRPATPMHCSGPQAAPRPQ